MAEILAELGELRSLFFPDFDDNSTDNATNVCEPSINHMLFHTYLLIPSSVTILVMAMMMKRTRVGTNVLGGRPGMMYPMDILSRSNRFSYAAAWGAVAYLASDVILSQKLAVNVEGPSYIRVFVVLLSMLIYGMDYLPLFASLAQNSLPGYIIGTLYAWLFFGIQMVKSSECDIDTTSRLLIILRDLPNILCLAYLSISLPVRFALLICRKQNLLYASDRVPIMNMKKDLRESVEGRHCLKLLRPPPLPPSPPEGVVNKIKGVVTMVTEKLLYKRNSGFRYSSRVVSVMLIGVILLYKTTIEILVVVLALLDFFLIPAEEFIGLVGIEPLPDEDPFITSTRQYVFFAYYIIVSFRVCFIVSISVATAIGLLMIIHMLASYRTNLFSLWRGDYTHIPPRHVQSNAGLLVGSMRYAGYQVGYIAWGYIIQLVILLLITVALAVIITLIRMGIYQWLIDVLHNVWPVLLTTLVINILQIVVAKFAFLQDRGNVLALNNRRVLFTFTFFMFFYNIFLGIVSCLLRIIKAIVIGAAFMSRLDNSTLPRRFQLMDPGFSAYVGFIHVESAHTHPVVISFLKLLMLQVEMRNEKNEEEKHENETKINMNGTKKLDEEAIRENSRISASARFKWYMLYTLYNNPQLRTSRKSYIDYMKVMQERLAKRYNLSRSTVGALVKTTNSSINTSGLGEFNMPAEVGSEGGKFDGWQELMSMNRFMANIERDMARRQQMNLGIDIEVDGDIFSNGGAYTKQSAENTSGNITLKPKQPAGWGKLRVAVGVNNDAFEDTQYQTKL